jgi:hypothetical protein
MMKEQVFVKFPIDPKLAELNGGDKYTPIFMKNQRKPAHTVLTHEIKQYEARHKRKAVKTEFKEFSSVGDWEFEGEEKINCTIVTYYADVEFKEVQ